MESPAASLEVWLTLGGDCVVVSCQPMTQAPARHNATPAALSLEEASVPLATAKPKAQREVVVLMMVLLALEVFARE